MVTTETRILEATAALLAEGGATAVSTRAVAEAAGVQAPALYRLFGDKQGLLDAAAAQAFEDYVRDKAARPPGEDPVADLRRGWDEHVEFGLAHPGVYILTYAAGRTGPPPPAAVEGMAVLAAKVHRVAAAGRLRVPEARAVELLHAAGSGATLAMIAGGERAVADLAREAVLAAITSDAPAAPEPGPAAAAVALGAVLAESAALTPGEQTLMREWLARIADA